ncbi:thioredoxin family protein [Kiritimatiellota bacterium B12222]|nr:thioredoxin family protein [Kiritimatiellota bacterium B12222]
MKKEITILLLIVGAFALINTLNFVKLPEDKDSHALLQTNDDNYYERIRESGDWVLLDFWAPWCPPCLRMKPALNEYAEENIETLRVLSVNVDESPLTVNQYRINPIPTIVLLYQGQEVARHSGELPKAALAIWIQSAKAEITP